MAATNKSNLPDDVFFALSLQGQACANKTAKTPPAKQGESLPSKAQQAALASALAVDPFGLKVSDPRSCQKLAERGLMSHVGGVESNRPTALYELTAAGRDLAQQLASAS